jgi:hypothetical protein
MNPTRRSEVRRLIPNLLAFLVIVATVPVRAQEPAKPASRAEATAIIANARKILTPNGVERLEKVRIGRIEQWVSVREADRRNPVLLYIHGGPGYVSIPMSWWFARGCAVQLGSSLQRLTCHVDDRVGVCGGPLRRSRALLLDDLSRLSAGTIGGATPGVPLFRRFGAGY